jgi:transcriptional regulator with XRE-family HTH domain
MKQKLYLPLPAVNALRKLGADINDARRRRRITMSLLAERARITTDTLKQIEKGSPATSIGGYVSVLYSLGMIDRFRDIADVRHDFIGLQLEEEYLPKRVRMPRKKNWL